MDSRKGGGVCSRHLIGGIHHELQPCFQALAYHDGRDGHRARRANRSSGAGCGIRGDRGDRHAQGRPVADRNAVAGRRAFRRTALGPGSVRSDGWPAKGDPVAEHAALPDRGRYRLHPPRYAAQPLARSHSGADERHAPASLRPREPAARTVGNGQPGLAGRGLRGVPRRGDPAGRDPARWRRGAVRLGCDRGCRQHHPEGRERGWVALRAVR